jgi:deoxyadenosine/deoxycytidine kinase
LNPNQGVQLLHVVGNIGAGKTTITNLLATRLNAGSVNADDFFQNSERLKRLFLSDTPRWAFTVELSLAAKRTGLLRRQLAQNPSGLLVVDGGVMISWMHARARFESGDMSADEWAIFSEVFDELVWDDVKESKVVVVTCSVETLLERIESRAKVDETRSFEPDAYDWDYLSYLQKGVEALAAKMKSENMDIFETTVKENGDVLYNPDDADRLVHRVTDTLDLTELLPPTTNRSS